MLPPWRASNTRTSAPSGATASRATGRCFIANVDTRTLRAGILREKFPGAELGRCCELGLETAGPVAEELVVGGRLVRLLGVARAAALGDDIGGIVDGVLLHELVAGADHRGARDGSAERPEQGARADLARRHCAEVRQRPLDDDDVLAGDLRNGSLVERNVLHRDAAGTRHGERPEDEEPLPHYFSTAPYVMFLSPARTGTRCLGDCIMNTTNMRSEEHTSELQSP